MSERYILVERNPFTTYEIWKGHPERPDEFYELMATTENRERARTLVEALNADHPVSWNLSTVHTDTSTAPVDWGDGLAWEIKQVHIFPNEEEHDEYEDEDEDFDGGPCGMGCHPHDDCYYPCPLSLRIPERGV